MKQIKRVFLLLLSVAVLIGLTGCGDSFFDTQHYQLPLGETEKAEQDLRTTKLAELKRPTMLVYVENGKAKYFHDGEEAFETILRLNEQRDQEWLNRDGSPRDYRDGYFDLVNTRFYRRGRYLFYRYEDGSYRDIVFSLPTSDEVDRSDYGTTLWFNQESADDPNAEDYAGGSYGDIGPADELMAYINSLR